MLVLEVEVLDSLAELVGEEGRLPFVEVEAELVVVEVTMALARWKLG